MTRTLAFVATAGLIGAAAFLTLGTALSGSGWASASYLWNGGSTCEPANGTQQQVTLPFVAGDRLVINLPGTIHYRSDEKAEAIISGDSALLNHLRIESGRLSLDCDPGWIASRLDVKLSGPAIARWDVLGNSELALSQINQPELRVSIEGSGSSSATGIADAVNLSISGSGEAQFEGLTAKSVTVRIRGSGDAKMTAQVDADVSVYGNGNVELSGQPAMRRAEIKGNGRIVQVP
ncbi:GIN domain-containing protein [Neorhizobium petrolearium]|uniref:GIN domain-containing protein n=1 Tax=Neorhizobium petrolearium TaxID=515361 RepID=UPI003F13DA46